MDKCKFCGKPFGLLQVRVLVSWRKRKGDRRTVIAHCCESCGEDRVTDFCQVVMPNLEINFK